MTQRSKSDCRVYWGTHGCNRDRGHSGRHFCECGAEAPDPHPNVVLYGEDAPHQGVKIEHPKPEGPFWQ